MSLPAPNAAEGSVASRTRRQRRRRPRDEEEEEQDTAQPSTYVSPAMRIYQHALEAILAMLELSDLSRALAVSGSWSAAVRSMAPIHASMERDEDRSFCEGKAFRPLPAVVLIIGSPLLRHVAAIAIRHASPSWTKLDNDSLGLLAQHAPNLTSLKCVLKLTPDEPFVLPPKLQSLHLQLGGRDADTINGVLKSLAALPSLLCLHLEFSIFFDESAVDLSILGACPSLVDLQLEDFEGDPPVLSDAQAKQIRSSLGHLQRFSVRQMESDDLARFLQPPVTVRWRDIGQVFADEPTGVLLRGLPSLSMLDLCYGEGTAQVDFLSQLSQLTSLRLRCGGEGGDWFIPADALLASLQLCNGITALDLSCGFNSAQWSALFTKLRIKKLAMGRGIDTLQCFASGPITQSLEELALELLDFPPSEVLHLYALRRLRTLRLDQCFSSPLTDAAIDSLTPPTSLLPSLTELRHAWVGSDDYDGEDGGLVERHGPSFEWMQQRLMH